MAPSGAPSDRRDTLEFGRRTASRRSPETTPQLARIVTTALTLCLVVTGCASNSLAERQEAIAEPQEAIAERQEAIAEAGAQVMPFDLERTTHVFEKQDEGGLQTVVSDDGDPEQIRLIREHLAEEGERFARGDFHDPAMLHGHDMPGLHQLVMGHDRMTVTWADVEGGAEIRYRSDDADMVEAIHAWFDAQLRDHGSHATSGHHGG